jgi:hypothetical protein
MFFSFFGDKCSSSQSQIKKGDRYDQRQYETNALKGERSLPKKEHSNQGP